MPIFTFQCDGCGFEKEVICRASERDVQTEQCPQAACPKFGDVLKWAGVEGSQVVRGNGRYEFKAIMGDGSKKTVAHHKARRSDS